MGGVDYTRFTDNKAILICNLASVANAAKCIFGFKFIFEGSIDWLHG